MYMAPTLSVLESSCATPNVTRRKSGLCRLEAIGRTRPKGPVSLGANGASTAALGVLGKALSTAWFCAGVVPGGGLVGSMVTVFNVVPSKLRESSTTLLKASMVVSAKEARIRVLLHGA